MTPRRPDNEGGHASRMGPAAFLLLVGALAFLLLTGCGPQERYQVLSVLFDGVPLPPGGTAQPAAAGIPGPDPAAPGSEKPRYVQHGPYAAKLCDGCHQQGTNKLLVRVEELCFTCHVFDSSGKKVHGPLASGGCTVCHDPHGSPNRRLLVSESREFCLTCHDRGALRSREGHGGGIECTACHDAHSSSNKYLLR